MYDVFEDRSGHIWFGTRKGVSRFDGDAFKNFSTANGLAYNMVVAIDQEPTGVLWFGTRGGGISRYDGRVFQGLTDRDGLIDNQVADILQDSEGNFWIATEKGITRYSPSHHLPSIRVTNVTVDRDRGPVGEVKIPGNQGHVAFEFWGRSLKTRPGQMVYVHRLVGFDEDWQVTRDQRVTYEDLPIGEYQFLVNAVDRDLDYSREPAVVKVNIVPNYTPMLVTSLLGLALIGIVLASGYAIKNRRERNQALLERNQALEQSNLQLQEMDQLKSEFVSYVSHDLRTPLTSIKGSVDNLLDGIPSPLEEKQIQYVERIQRNAERLMRLINDLLDLSRIEAGRLELHLLDLVLGPLVLDVIETVQGQAVEKSISLELIDEATPAKVHIDPDRVHQILSNLVGNAVKFTPTGGRVVVRLDREAEWARISVRDNGKGIPADKQGRIFDKFQRVTDNSGEREGAGLGLAIARSLVGLHEGNLWVESKEGQGTTFFFTLPIAKIDRSTEVSAEVGRKG